MIRGETDGEDFFNTLSSNKASKPKPKKQEIKKRRKKRGKKDESSNEHLMAGSKIIEKVFVRPNEVDKDVKAALITGNYRLAIDLSLKAGNVADALVFAYYGQDKSLWDIASKSYFDQHSQQFIANTFKYISANDYNHLVQNSVKFIFLFFEELGIMQKRLCFPVWFLYFVGFEELEGDIGDFVDIY